MVPPNPTTAGPCSHQSYAVTPPSPESDLPYGVQVDEHISSQHYCDFHPFFLLPAFFSSLCSGWCPCYDVSQSRFPPPSHTGLYDRPSDLIPFSYRSCMPYLLQYVLPRVLSPVTHTLTFSLTLHVSRSTFTLYSSWKSMYPPLDGRMTLATTTTDSYSDHPF